VRLTGARPARTPALSRRAAFVIAFTLVTAAAAFLLPAVPQPLDYHDFADQRRAFGVDNFLDVVSNAAFLGVGLVGLFVVCSGRARFEFPAERWPYAVFFLGILLTAAGSGWYHLSPDNESLFWDRLPMTIAFMGLVSSQIVDRISVRAGLVLLGPLLLVGVASVVYWIVTERAGAGNVLPYAFLQGYAIVVVLIMAVLLRSRYTRANDVYFIFGWYVLAKGLEMLDAEVLAHTHVVSGHTLKHVAAAVAGVVACRMLTTRMLADPESGDVAPPRAQSRRPLRG
jgi:hypothetical protein